MLGGVLLDRIFAYLLPEYCFGCGTEGNSVCAACAKTIETPTFLSDIPDHQALWVYKSQSLQAKLIKAWKYQFQKKAFGYLVPAMEHVVNMNKSWFKNIDMVVPIPLHPRREAERGFNQSDMIAKEMGRVIGVPWSSILKRQRKTKSQARLGKEERKENMHQAFILDRDIDVRGMSFLLVDDVYTTGATMREAASALMAHRAKQVLLFTLCKDELGDRGSSQDEKGVL